MATEDLKGNGFVSGEALPAQAPDAPLDDQEIADFLARAAMVRDCQASAFVGRKVCRLTFGVKPFIAFADELSVPDGTAVWDVPKEIAELAQRQVVFMQGLGQEQPPAAASPGQSQGQSQGSAELFAALLKRCSHEIQNDGSVIYQLDKTNVFVDHGRQLLMEPAADRNDEAILVALLLAKEKFKSFEITGDANFQRKALEIMVRHNLDVPIKNAAQQALKDELVKAHEATKKDQAPAAARAAQPSSAAGEKGVQPGNGVSGGSDLAGKEELVKAKPPKAPLSEATRCVDAHAWWQSQVAIISSSARSEKEKEDQLEKLGKAPEEGKAWWFDSAGHPRPEPKDPEVARRLRESAGMVSTASRGATQEQAPVAAAAPVARKNRRSAKAGR